VEQKAAPLYTRLCRRLQWIVFAKEDHVPEFVKIVIDVYSNANVRGIVHDVNSDGHTPLEVLMMTVCMKLLKSLYPEVIDYIY